MRTFSFHGRWSVKEERNETTWRSPYIKMHGKRLRPSPARRGLTENDVMKCGQDLYSYLRMEERNGDILHDGTHVIYVNGAAKGDSAVCKLIHDLLCRDTAEMYFDLLRKRVGEFKNSEEGRHTMCRAMERFRSEGKAEGKAEGIVEGEARGKRETMLATAKRMLKDGILALKDVARYSGLSLAQVKKLQSSMA